MLAKAVGLCDAKFGNIYRWDGDALTLVATHNTPAALAEARKRTPILRFGRKNPVGHMIATKSVVHVDDAAASEAYIENDPATVAAVDLGGTRTFVAVPMLKENELLGAFALARQEVRPFTNRQIELVKSFAAQAVIAIENARLLNELRQRTDDLSQRTTDLTEALEQQTATSEVLGVISGSPGNLEPVFAAMLENAIRICEATFGNIYRAEGDGLRHVATHNTPPAFAQERKSAPYFTPGPKSPVRRMMTTKAVVHVLDNAATEAYAQRDPGSVAAVELGGARTVLYVPLLKENELLGAFTLSRQEVRPFTDKQIALVTNFAAQAVIAIENARLLNELRERTDDLSQRTTDLTEALEQQTATSAVLSVISSSRGDLEPVFRSLLQNATSICHANFGNLALCEGSADFAGSRSRYSAASSFTRTPKVRFR